MGVGADWLRAHRFVFWIQVVTLKFKAQFKFVGKEMYWRKSHEAL